MERRARLGDHRNVLGQPPRASSTWARWLAPPAMLAVTGFVLQLGSERAYWFYSPAWFGPRLGETLVIAVVYALAAALPLWLLGRVAFRGWCHIVLAGAVFAWTVEGVVVSVLHEAGPFDLVYPAMFAGWHGLLSFSGLFYLVRRLLVDRRPWVLAAISAVGGLIVGAWAVTTWLPDSDEALQPSGTWPASPLDFAITMTLVVAALAAAHLVLDRFWPAGWRPGRLASWLMLGSTGLLVVLSFAQVAWGPVRYGALVAIPITALAAQRGDSAGPNLFGALAGRVQAQHLMALAPAVVTAAGSYAIVWAVEPAESTLELLRTGLVLLQISAGGTVVAWATWRALRLVRVEARRPRAAPEPPLDRAPDGL